jgi:YgiT-type zinc finger domain-containing protein
MNNDADEPKEFCEVCHTGSMRPLRLPYAHWYDGQLVIVPGMRAWCCDFCGETVYDEYALARLALLLGPDANSEDQRRRRTPGLDENRAEGLGDRRLV